MITLDIYARVQSLAPNMYRPSMDSKTYEQLCFRSREMKDCDSYERFPTAWQQKLIDEWTFNGVPAAEIEARINNWIGH